MSDLTPQEIFWLREARWAVEIRETGQRFYEQYAGEGWHDLSDTEKFPWCLVAERQLTAVRISKDRARAWELLQEARGQEVTLDTPARIG